MGISATTAAPAFKAAMVEAMRDLVVEDNVLVTFGAPGQDALNFNDVVSFEDVTSEQEPATIGPNRPREEVLTLQVVFESFRPGGQDMEQVASDAAYELLGRLERHVRVTDTTVGGTVRQCFLTTHRSSGMTEPEDLKALDGRLIQVEATFVALVRITG